VTIDLGPTFWRGDPAAAYTDDPDEFDRLEADKSVAAWNEANPAGTAVRLQGDSQPYYRTKGAAWNRGGVPVVRCDGIPPCTGFDRPVQLDRLTAVSGWDTGI